MKAEDVVVNLIKLNDRELIGRTRLQKEAYLLDRCGAEFGLSFTYYQERSIVDNFPPDTEGCDVNFRVLPVILLLRSLLLRACRWMGGRAGRRSD